MHRHQVAIVVVAAAAAAVSAPQAAARQAAPLSAATIRHVGVVVPDLDAALREYARVMGVAATKMNSYSLPLPNGGKADVKVTVVRTANFAIELVQPVTAAGAFYDHMKRHGPSIQHLRMQIPGATNVDEYREGLERKGGRWVLGDKGATYAHLEFDMLGTCLETGGGDNANPVAEPIPSASAKALPPLASFPATHIGFAVTDAAAVTNAFARLLGITPPPVMDYKDSQYPPGTAWNPKAYLRLASWNQQGMGLEFIEPVGGPTPWSDFVARHKGSAPQHVAFNVGDRLDEMIGDLRAKGGKWTNGKPGGGYAYVDFTHTLGLVFELNGTSKAVRAQ